MITIVLIIGLVCRGKDAVETIIFRLNKNNMGCRCSFKLCLYNELILSKPASIAQETNIKRQPIIILGLLGLTWLTWVFFQTFAA
jgi:hypothetical protein